MHKDLMDKFLSAHNDGSLVVLYFGMTESTDKQRQRIQSLTAVLANESQPPDFLLRFLIEKTLTFMQR